jgi:hypothetical protein
MNLFSRWKSKSAPLPEASMLAALDKARAQMWQEHKKGVLSGPAETDFIALREQAIDWVEKESRKDHGLLQRFNSKGGFWFSSDLAKRWPEHYKRESEMHKNVAEDVRDIKAGIPPKALRHAVRAKLNHRR